MQAIAHNLSAQFSSRQLGINGTNKEKAMEKLASGYRINRSADDAAGLKISEKMRAQIRGLRKASNNAQDGISLIQTAEGALNEVHSVLQRMNELAVQAANDTNTNEDRDAIQEEINQLCTEINRVSDTTTFNNILVLKAPQLIEVDGSSLSEAVLDKRYTITTSGSSSVSKSVWGVSMDFANLTSGNLEDLIGKSFTTTCTDSCKQVFTFQFTDDTTSSATLSGGDSPANPSIEGRADLTVKIGMKDASITNGTDIVNKIIELVKGQQSNSGSDLKIGHANGLTSDGSKLIFYSISGGPNYADGMGLLKASDFIEEEKNLTFQIGANAGQGMGYIIRTINTDTLNLGRLKVNTYKNAGDTITKVQNAIDKVSEYRSYLGATQNRLEYTMRANDNTVENIQNSESIIRDADMSTEMVEFTKQSILEQAAQAMLAQAKQSNEGVLNLLR